MSDFRSIRILQTRSLENFGIVSIVMKEWMQYFMYICEINKYCCCDFLTVVYGLIVFAGYCVQSVYFKLSLYL
jgi:hypothetical protein